MNYTDTKITKIAEAFHSKIIDNSRRFSRLSGNIVLDNMVLQLLARNSSFSPGACCKILREDFGKDCREDIMVRIFRDYHVNSEDRRKALLKRVVEIADSLKMAMNGDMQSLSTFRAAFDALVNDESVRRAKIYSNLVLAVVLERIPELNVEQDRRLVLNFGFAICKSLLEDLADIVEEVYSEPANVMQSSDVSSCSEIASAVQSCGVSACSEAANAEGQHVAVHAGAPAEAETANSDVAELERRLAEMERRWKRADRMLDNLENDFKEQLEEVKQQEFTEFFGRLNSEKYGRILDSLMEAYMGITLLRQKGYALPAEINGVFSIVGCMLQFVRDSKINPMLLAKDVIEVKGADITGYEYYGTPFASLDASKRVQVVSPGWVYGEKNVMISLPVVKEVQQ